MFMEIMAKPNSLFSLPSEKSGKVAIAPKPKLAPKPKPKKSAASQEGEGVQERPLTIKERMALFQSENSHV